jgi:hypothetical protein
MSATLLPIVALVSVVTATDAPVSSSLTPWGDPDLRGVYSIDLDVSDTTCGRSIVVPPLASHVVRIIQSPGWVAVDTDRTRRRLIPLDRALSTLTPLGTVDGRWESGALVITTTNPPVKVVDALFGGRTADGIHFVERLQRLDGQRLQYEFLVSDPGTYERPWTLSARLTRTSSDDVGNADDLCAADPVE